MEWLLSDAPVAKWLSIKQINIQNLELSRRLSEIGFVCEQKIIVLSEPTKQSKLIGVRGSVFALDKEVCKMVVVHD